MAFTPSEALVEKLSKRSFLSLWSYPNPRATSGKELCDMLIVCDPDVIVVSVKEIRLKDADNETEVTRWHKKAIEKSLNQLAGAERHLPSLERVITFDGKSGIRLPELEWRRIHRIAVALGSDGAVGFEQGDFGKGFVHILDDRSLQIVMEELDTITDFVEYLLAKEALISSGTTPLVTGGEQDLLAIYLHQGRSFTPSAPVLLVDHGSWQELVAKPEWSRRKLADKTSYLWDELIEGVGRNVLGPGLEFGNAEEAERVTRIMARESRFARRMLADSFIEFLDLASANRIRSRIIPSPSGVHYVLLATPHGESREGRTQELGLRCLVARSLLRDGSMVVGIAREHYVTGKGYSLDVCLVDIPNWNSTQQRAVDKIKSELGYFANPLYSRASDDEFPQPT